VTLLGALALTPPAFAQTASVQVTESPASVAAFAEKCKWVKHTVTYRSLLGSVLYRYWEKQSFCYNGSTITALYDYSRGKSDVDPTWSWEGHTGLWRTGGVGTGGASVKTEGHFQQTLGPINLNRYPWVIIRMDNSGAVITNGHN
jgi:hypothetical protein